MIKFSVIGIPQTAGSKRAFPFRRGDGSLGVRVSDDNPKGANWKQAVAYSALESLNGHRGLLTGALVVVCRFYRPRPKGHYKSNGELSKAGRESTAPTTKPDATKLFRCCEDALNKVIWADDAQIVDQHVTKHWGEPARLEIEIREIDTVDQTALIGKPEQWGIAR